MNAVTEKIFILPASSFCAGGEQGNDACQVTLIMPIHIFYRAIFVPKGAGSVIDYRQ